MDKNNVLSQGGANIQSDLSGENVFCECTGEFTLPDYLPEIRKIIRIDGKAIPSGKFLSSSKAEFAGIVAYTIIYSGAEGELASCSLSCDYEFSCNIPSNDLGDLSIIVDTELDNTVCRLSGPRKLSLRSSIKNKVHIYANSSIKEISDDMLHIEKLSENVLSSVTKCGGSGEFYLSDSTNIDNASSEELRASYIRAEILVREARASANSILCRGDVLLKCLCTLGGAEPITVSRKIPFEESIVADGAIEGDSCIAYGRCNSATVSISDNGTGGSVLNFDVNAELEGECVRNEKITIVRDLYSTDCAVIPVYKDVIFTESLGACMGNYTVSASRERSEDELDITSIIDTNGKIEIKETFQKDGRAIVTGECKIDMLTGAFGEEKSEYSSSSVIIPFKIETDLRALPSDNLKFDCHAELVSSHGRLDQSTIGADAEIFIAIKCSHSVCRATIDSITLDESKKCNKNASNILVVYPESDDTLFSIAKRYQVSYAELARINGLPESSIESPNGTHSIDGITHLIIP